MLISDDKKVLFVHVPKTGGMSVEEAVKEACPDAGNKPRGVGDDWRHATLARILEEQPQAQDYWTFGFVRNPWARMLSWYSMIDRWSRRWGPASGKPQLGQHEGMRNGNDMWVAAAAYGSFEEFVLRGTEELPRLGDAQVSYLRAQSVGKEADFIGRTESFGEDLQTVQRHLGVEPTPVPHRNKSRHGTYHDYYSEVAQEKIAEVYAEDIDLFGYTY